VEFRILGPLEVATEGRPVALLGSRERTVLALLLLSANHVVPTARLVEELWGGRAPKGAAEPRARCASSSSAYAKPCEKQVATPSW